MAGIIIKSEREYLREICTKIDSGYYAIPVFQRDYVWKKEQVLELFDSISKGYPIGSVMLWRPIDMLNSKDILTDEIKEEPAPAYYVLDGRQRLTTFYGCVSNREKDEIFKLSYNLENETFEYSRKERVEVLQVSDIYDTFTLLTKLQQIMSCVQDQEKAKMYIENARRLNTILQSYVIGEMLLDNCSLDEASIVFTRINSKGTNISKTFMLQAVSYKKENGILLSKEIDGILESLQPYDFDKLSSDDILNCFYRWYSGKNFYDAQMKDMEGVNFTVHLQEIKETILRTVEFLYDECHVLSSRILPYSKQLIALTWFFKEFKQPTVDQIKELKKWFYYTTSCQSFQNSSLSNVRFIFNRFEEYVLGKNDLAFDYEPIRLDNAFNFKFRIGTAKTNFMILAFIEQYYKIDSLAELHYNGYYRIIKNSPECYFIYLNDRDRDILYQYLVRQEVVFAPNLEKYMLDSNMLEQLLRGNNAAFMEQRRNAIVTSEGTLLEELGLEVLL